MRKYVLILMLAVFAATMMWTRPPQSSTARTSEPIPVAAPSADAVRAFNDAFGKELRKVVATPDVADDLALAGQFVKGASSPGESGDMVMLLCDSAHGLASRSADGDELALEALQILARRVPARVEDCRGRAIKLLERRTQTGKPEQKQAAAERLFDLLIAAADDAIAARDWENANQYTSKAQRTAATLKWPEMIEQAEWRSDQMKMRRIADSRVKTLSAKLAENPWDGKSIDELVRVLLVELDDVREAQKYINRSGSDAANRLLPLLTESPDVLGAEQHRQIGQWYVDMAEGASAVGQWQSLLNARFHYQAYFTRASGDSGVAHTAATGNLRRIEDQLAALQETARTRSGARGLTATINWLGAEPVDVCINGKPLIDSTQDFKTRTGERGELKQARCVIRKGDVITVGAKRNSGGFALMAVDREGKLLLTSDAENWKTYFPLDDKQWSQPKVAQKARQQQVFANKLSPQQQKLFEPYGAMVSSLAAPQSDKGEKYAYFIHTVKDGKGSESAGIPVNGAGYFRVPTARGDAVLTPVNTR